MAGRGEPSRAYRPESAIIRIEFLRDTPLRFPNSERAGEAQEGDDDIYLPTLPAGRSWYTDREQNLARALKACARIIVDAPLQETLVLSRTNRVYGEDLNAFVEKLVSIVAQNMTADRHPIAEKIKGMTVHKSKGHEADTVIVLDVTLGAIPLVHPDNALLNIFGVTSQSVLDDERRLFYVAITRAKDRLFLLTERGNESPFLRWINERGAAAAECVEVTDWSHVPADLC